MSKEKFSFDFTITWCYVQERNVPDDDVRLAATREIIAKIQKKNNWGRPAQTETMKEGNLEQEDGDEMHVAADGDESAMQDFVAEDHDAEEDQSSEHFAEEDQSSSEHIAAVGESRTSPWEWLAGYHRIQEL